MGVHWTPSWSSILHLLLHITILQNVWQLFCIHLTARIRKTRSFAKVKEQYNSPVLAPSWQQQNESSSSRRWSSRQPRSGPGRSTLQSVQPLSPPPETFFFRAWRPCERRKFTMLRSKPNTSIRRSKALKMYLVEFMMITESWAEFVKFLKVFNWSQKWKTRSKIEFGLFWMRDKGIHNRKIVL